MSRSPVARAALVAALAAVWAIAAYFLWQSKIPSSLHLPHIVVRDYFSASELHDAARFGQFSSRMWILSTVVEVVVFVLYARWGVRFMRESAAGPVGTGMLLGMIGFALLWLAELPFDVVSLWWERRHGLSHESYFDHITANWFALGGQFVFLCVALGVAMGLARLLGDWWWLPAALFFVGLATLFAFVSPYLLTTHKLHDAALASQVRSLEQAEGVRHVPVVVQQVHTVTALPNAEAMGLGPSRRIVLWDTLIDGRFSERELRVVLAHEIGHLARHHIWKDVAWYALFAFPGVYLLMRITRRRGGMGDAGGGAARAARARRPRSARAAASERDLASSRGGGGLDGTADDARSRRGDAVVPQVRLDDTRRAEPVDVGLRHAREPPDDRAAHRNGAGVAPVVRVTPLSRRPRPTPSCARGRERLAAPARRARSRRR